MKRRNLILAVLPLFMVLLALQSCKKDEPMFKVYYAFTDPVPVSPLDGATVKITGTTVELKWASTDADGDSPLADVYFGTASNPPLYKAGNTALTLTVPVELGKTYYWHVTMIDANKVMSPSPGYGPTWSFTVFEPIGIFVGLFNADEPAENYSYDVSFVKTSATTILTDNYWNSGWNATFTLDFTAKTYSMPLTTWSGGYSGIESGTIDPATGKMVGNYIIYKSGKSVEEGVHTYTKK